MLRPILTGNYPVVRQERGGRHLTEAKLRGTAIRGEIHLTPRTNINGALAKWRALYVAHVSTEATKLGE